VRLVARQQADGQMAMASHSAGSVSSFGKRTPPKPIRRRRTDRKEIGWYGFAAQGGCTPIIGPALPLIGQDYIGLKTLLIP
jgi:hypothetical protein